MLKRVTARKFILMQISNFNIFTSHISSSSASEKRLNHFHKGPLNIQLLNVTKVMSLGGNRSIFSSSDISTFNLPHTHFNICKIFSI